MFCPAMICWSRQWRDSEGSVERLLPLLGSRGRFFSDTQGIILDLLGFFGFLGVEVVPFPEQIGQEE